MSKPASAVLLLAVLAGCESSPILLYHHIGERNDPPRWVSDSDFRAQMIALLDAGFTPITAVELDAIDLYGRTAPKKPIVITFDDGFTNFYGHAYPILKELGITATMFLVTSRISDTEATRQVLPFPQLIWPEIFEMQLGGIDFQSHSATHPRLPDLSDADARAEIFGSKAVLDLRMGRPCTVFAYPYGSNGKRERGLVEEAGYESGHSVESGTNGIFQRQRVSIHFDETLETYDHKLGGTWWGESSGLR